MRVIWKKYFEKNIIFLWNIWYNICLLWVEKLSYSLTFFFDSVYLIFLKKFNGLHKAATQYPIIRNHLIRNSAEFLGKFKKRALSGSNLRNASKNLRNGQFKAKKRLTSNIFHLYVSSIFSLFFILEWSTLSVELNFTTIVVF